MASKHPLRRSTDRGHPLRRSTDPKPAAGIGALVDGLLIKGKTTDQIVAAVHQRFPESNTSAKTVSWYRSKLRASGRLK